MLPERNFSNSDWSAVSEEAVLFHKFSKTLLVPFLFQIEKRLSVDTLLATATISLCLFHFFINSGLQIKRKLKNELSNYTQTLPYVRFFRFFKIPILDGVILLYKLRKDGVKVAEQLVAKYGANLRASIVFMDIAGISDPDIIQKILSSSNIGHLSKPQVLYDYLFTDLLKDGLLSSKVGIWLPHRKAASKSFTYKSFPTYLKFINDGAQELVQSACIASAAKPNNGEIGNEEMTSIIDYYVVKIITKIIMGSEKFDISDEQRSTFHANFKRLKEISLERFHRPELMIPPIWWLHPMKRELDRLIKEIREFSNQITDNYRMKDILQTQECNQRNDDELKRANRENGSECSPKQRENEDEIGVKPFECLVEQLINSGISNKEIADEVATFLVAGHETVKVALDLLIFHLARSKEHQEKCRQEVDELLLAFNSHDEKISLTLDDTSKLKYLERCILESMRLTPTIPFFLRQLHEPLEISKDCTIPVGESLMIMPWIVHRNEKYYPNPEKFDPDRFLPENVKQRHPYSFISFSMGMRNCVGWKIALIEMKVIMAWILRNFEMTTTDEPENVKLLFDITLKLERKYNVMFKRRENKD